MDSKDLLAVRETPLLMTLLGAAAVQSEVGARESFVLSDRTTCHHVRVGSLDVFLLDDRGRRHHLFRVEAGGLLFGMGADGPSEARVLAVPGNGTCLSSFPREALIGSPLIATAATGPVVEWLRISGGALPVDAVPAEARRIQPGDRLTGKGAVVAGGPEPIWLERTPEGTSFVGEIIPSEKGRRRLLLSGGGWVRLPTDEVTGDLEAISVNRWWEEGDCWADLDVWHDLLRSAAAKRVEAERAAEEERIASNAFARARDLNETVETLARVAERKPIAVDTSPSALFSACRLVANELGIELSLPQGGAEALERSIAPVEDIGYASRIQTQRVALPPGWWHEDHGPLLAFRGPERRPCALIMRQGHYNFVEHGRGRPERVTAHNAGELAEDAFMFFQPLPDRKLGLRDLLNFCLPGMQPDFLTIIIMVVLSGFAALVPPLATDFIISTIIPASSSPQAVLIGVVVLATGAAAALFQMVQAIALLRVEGRLDQRLQPALWDRLLKLPPAFFRRFSVGDLANRVQMVDAIRAMLTGSIISSAISSILGIFSFALMLYYAPMLSLVLAVLTFLIALVSFLIGRTVVSIDRQQLALGGRIQSVTFQLLGALGKLRVTATESVAFGHWAGLFRDSQILANRTGMLNVLLQTTTGVFPPLALLVIIAFIGIDSGQFLAYFRIPDNWSDINAKSIDQVMPTADFMAFITAYIQFSTAVLGFIGVSVRLVVLKPMLERVRPLLETPTEGDAALIDPGQLAGHIVLQDISFRYAPDSPLVLRGVSLEVEPGEFVALVGNSGGGRSTLVRLLLGFERPESGQILIDGQDLARLDKRRVRQQLGVVLQDGRLITGTIFENICAGGHYTEEEAWAAARAAGFASDVENLPEGMKTPLADGATTLSGGQRQRLMIARALVRKPRVMVFDEATSALDNESQQIVGASLAAMDISRIVIAHRVASIRSAKRIYVVNDGEVVEAGNWDELIALKGAFAELVKRQVA